ncbi:MAG: DNA polymerase III subunit beta [Lentisphaerae bacterium]|nr:DNA polymerase III subunit beta [Lentisphaerota bacterium]
MKLKVTKANLLGGLQIVQNVVSIRSTLPILSNVLLNAEKGKLSLTTSDLDVTVHCSVEADVSKPGAGTLPARRLLSIIRELPDSVIEIELDDRDTGLVCCGASRYKILGLSADEFPPLPKADGKYRYTLEQKAFQEMLRKCSYAVSTDETRYVLNGVLISFKDGKLVTVASDGRRLALVECELEFPKEAEKDMILPTKAINELLHTLQDEGDVKISAKENQVIFEYNGIVMASKLIDGTYPNYRQVIPAETGERITVERELLLTALKRVSLVTSDKSNAAKLTFEKNNLLLSMNTPDVGEAEEKIPVKYGGKSITVAFNPEYVMDPLRNLASDEIYFELSDELSAGVIKCDTPFLYVLMPMRIN